MSGLVSYARPFGSIPKPATNMPNAKKYAAQFYATKRELQSVTADGAKRMAEIIAELRGDITDKLKSHSPGDPDAPFTTRILPSLTKSINESLDSYLTDAGDVLNSGMGGAFELGAGDLLKAVEVGDIEIGTFAPSVSKELLVALSNASGDVLSEITSDLGESIITQIKLNAAGLQPASYAIQRISRMIADSDEVENNLRKRIGFDAQANAIVRTEVQRAFSVAHHASATEFSKVIPGLKKVWIASGNGRRTHEEAEDRYSVGGSEGPIPVESFFEVEDDSMTGESEFFTFSGRGGQRVARTMMHPRSGVSHWEKLLFPRDPEGSPGSTINCSCSVLELVPGLEEAGDVEEEDVSDIKTENPEE